MSRGMYGADVAQLRDLARQLQSASDRLNGARQRIGSGIRIAAWVGPVAVRFRMLWDGEYSRQVQDASDALERIAREVLHNAEEQERASARDGGAGSVTAVRLPTGELWPGGGGMIPIPGRMMPGSRWTLESLQAFLETLGLVGSAVTVLEWARTLQETQLIRGAAFTGPALGKVLLPVGAVLSILGTAEAIEKGDVVGALLEGGSGAATTGLGVAAVIVGGTAAVGLGVVGVGVAALFGVADFGLPLTQEKQEASYRQGVREVFGRGVDPNALTPDQEMTMRRRYEGGFGLATRISDTMVASGEPMRQAIEDGGYWVGGVAENTKERLKNVFRR